jgi:ribosomal protein L12E/L44/L45/RPP1/RPP2
MPKVGRDQDFDEIFSKIGPDATATKATTAVDGEDEELEEKDDDAAALEEDAEEDEEEDVKDKAGV